MPAATTVVWALDSVAAAETVAALPDIVATPAEVCLEIADNSVADDATV